MAPEARHAAIRADLLQKADTFGIVLEPRHRAGAFRFAERSAHIALLIKPLCRCKPPLVFGLLIQPFHRGRYPADHPFRFILGQLHPEQSCPTIRFTDIKQRFAAPLANRLPPAFHCGNTSPCRRIPQLDRALAAIGQQPFSARHQPQVAASFRLYARKQLPFLHIPDAQFRLAAGARPGKAVVHRHRFDVRPVVMQAPGRLPFARPPDVRAFKRPEPMNKQLRTVGAYPRKCLAQCIRKHRVRLLIAAFGVKNPDVLALLPVTDDPAHHYGFAVGRHIHRVDIVPRPCKRMHQIACLRIPQMNENFRPQHPFFGQHQQLSAAAAEHNIVNLALKPAKRLQAFACLCFKQRKRTSVISLLIHFDRNCKITPVGAQYYGRRYAPSISGLQHTHQLRRATGSRLSCQRLQVLVVRVHCARLIQILLRLCAIPLLHMHKRDSLARRSRTGCARRVFHHFKRLHIVDFTIAPRIDRQVIQDLQMVWIRLHRLFPKPTRIDRPADINKAERLVVQASCRIIRSPGQRPRVYFTRNLAVYPHQFRLNLSKIVRAPGLVLLKAPEQQRPEPTWRLYPQAVRIISARKPRHRAVLPQPLAGQHFQHRYRPAPHVCPARQLFAVHLLDRAICRRVRASRRKHRLAFHLHRILDSQRVRNAKISHLCRAIRCQ